MISYSASHSRKVFYSFVLLTSLNLLPLALCVSKLPHINIVDFFITRSFNFVEVTLARHNSSKFGSALAYS